MKIRLTLQELQLMMTTPLNSLLFNNVDLFNVEPFNFTSADLCDLFVHKFGERPILYSLSDTTEMSLVSIVNKMNTIIRLDTKANNYRWETLKGTVGLEYNPIENYDRQENRTETRTPDITSQTTGNTTSTINNTVNNSVTTDDDVVNYNNRDKVSTQGTDTGTVNNTVKTTGNEQLSVNSRVHGNIGVTTSQQMLQSEREVADFSVINDYLEAIANQILLKTYF